MGFDTAENEPFDCHIFSSLQGFNFHRAVVSAGQRCLLSPPAGQRLHQDPFLGCGRSVIVFSSSKVGQMLAGCWPKFESFESQTCQTLSQLTQFIKFGKIRSTFHRKIVNVCGVFDFVEVHNYGNLVDFGKLNNAKISMCRKKSASAQMRTSPSKLC